MEFESDILGEFAELFRFVLRGNEEPVPCQFKGHVVSSHVFLHGYFWLWMAQIRIVTSLRGSRHPSDTDDGPDLCCVRYSIEAALRCLFLFCKVGFGGERWPRLLCFFRKHACKVAQEQEYPRRMA